MKVFLSVLSETNVNTFVSRNEPFMINENGARQKDEI
jgi:hypothetical protein